MADTSPRGLVVILATDGSPSAETAMELVRTVSWPQGSVIHLVSAVEPSELVMSGALAPGLARDAEDAVNEVVGGAQVVLGRAARSLESTGVQVDVAVLRGRAASAIVEKAATVKADLIVVGSRGHGTIGTMVLGSVSAEVADHAPCPVLVARRAALAKVILGTDGSSYARAAERVVTDWPIFASSAIEVVSVASIGLPWTSGLALSADANINEEFVESGLQVVAEYQVVADATTQRLAAAGRRATGRVLQGDAAAELVRVAHEDDADLIAVGTHGRTGLRRLLAGSVARNVMLHAPCSVLIVREARPLT